MDNLYQLHPHKSKNLLMTQCLSLLESRGIPMVLFISRLNNINVDCNSKVSQHIDIAINSFGGQGVWLEFLKEREAKYELDADEEFEIN